MNLLFFSWNAGKKFLKTRSEWAEKIGIPKSFVEKICQNLHEESIRIQTDVMNKK